ncbi:MAG: hypothetical protein HDS11_02750 [Bacteroides sp.]|nr:hypothetical protein [Bacteroides sp.]
MQETKFKHIIVEDINKMPDLNKFPTEPIPLNNDKWNELYLSRENRTFLQKNFSKMSNFNDLAKVEVGITTGANNFFSLTDEEVKKLKAKAFVKPLLGRSTLINGVFYDQATFTSSQNTNKKVWLLDLNNCNQDSLPIELNQYIYLAELKHIHHAYKLRIRNKWYQIPGIWAPQGFLSRRIGNIPKLVINKVNAVSTDTFHRIKIKENVNINLLLIAFYSSPSLVSLELAGRVFGGGVLEILPGDSKQFKLPNINYYDDTLLDHEICELNQLMMTTNDVIKVSEYCDNILQRKLGYKFDSIKFENILASLQSLRQNT